MATVVADTPPVMLFGNMGAGATEQYESYLRANFDSVISSMRKHVKAETLQAHHVASQGSSPMGSWLPIAALDAAMGTR
eukprot:CAMPEP_0180649774 /NCGR_PEP_ID=MMETSP1037_2-20121125/51800_1 /TAXON_ID=632150 /ORGANISM="Azadinium spinosum, Strain 3D9" /LENGTH=78 /DNA_ID=CAMNT_0022674917 /DNA_START=62 /DNA_END=295 /DNA_ORIENTATION=+